MYCTACGSPLDGRADFCTSCGSVIPPAGGAGEQKAESVAQDIQYADFWVRLIAYIMDAFIVYLPTWFIYNLVVFSLEYFSKPPNIFFVIPFWLYYAVMESSPKQATVGKIILKIYVTDLKGDRITFLRATNRFLGRVASSSIFMLGYIMAAFTKKKQGLHDLLAGTLVVNKTSELQETEN